METKDIITILEKANREDKQVWLNSLGAILHHYYNLADEDSKNVILEEFSHFYKKCKE